MAATLNRAIRIACWFWGLFPLVYYFALTVICGIYRKWISFAFALAISVVLSVWLVLNGVAIVSAVMLNRRRQGKTKGALELSAAALAGDFLEEGTAPVATSPQMALVAADVRSIAAFDPDEQRAFAAAETGLRHDDDDSDEDFFSIRESIRTSPPTGVDTVSLSSANLEVSPRASVATANPLATKSSGTVRSRRGLVVHAQRGTGTASSERTHSEADTTRLLSPPNADQPLGMVAVGLPSPMPASALVAADPHNAKTTPEKQINSASYSAGSDGHGAAKLGGTAPTGGVQNRDAEKAAAARSKKSSKVTSRVFNSSRSVKAAYMMPLVSVYVTLALSLLILAASVLFVYETHCLMLAYHSLAVPCLWATLVPLRRFFDAYKCDSHNLHIRMLRVLTHWIGLLATALLSLAVYVVAMSLDITVWPPYRVDDAPTPRALRVISYLAPISPFVIAIFLVVNSSLTSQSIVRRLSRRHERSLQRRATSITAAACSAPPPCGRAESDFGPLSGFPGTSAEQCSPLESSLPRADQNTAVSPRNSPLVELENSTSMLSSIVQSTMGSSVFIPSSSLASPSKASIGKNHIRDSRTSSSGGSGSVSGPPNIPAAAAAAAHTTSLPQLKTVTMLYIAYRNIYDDQDNIHGSISHSQAVEGMAAHRSMQQTISTNYEAIMEAIDDAREIGSADANAYVLTAYEDALCLVWGLVPFSSEPVLLAIEKARQIMEAFRSRPKPQPTSTDEQLELVAAVVSAPHSLVGVIGTGSYRSIHFFNSRQHDGGAQLLQRGLGMYRRLPSLQVAARTSGNTFSGILMNGRAWHSTASQILARPCGIKYVPAQVVPNTRAAVRRLPIGIAARTPTVQYPIMYEFLEFVQAKEEEWHLLVQRQERLGAKFGFLSKAVQLLQQGDPNGAREVLARAMENTECGNDADSITLAQIMLEDLDRVTSRAGQQ